VHLDDPARVRIAESSAVERVPNAIAREAVWPEPQAQAL